MAAEARREDQGEPEISSRPVSTARDRYGMKGLAAGGGRLFAERKKQK